jgi:anti-sigma28 factor (negative regulator of flagellin synthesis)
MAERKTAKRHPRRDGNLLRSEKIALLKKSIESGSYQTEYKFEKIIDVFIREFVK